MKKLFILLFFFPLYFFSQKEEDYLIKNLHSLWYKDPKWKKFDAKISEEEKIKLITPLFFDDSEQYCKGDSITNPQQFLKYYSSVFHFTDIDNDKDIDLVFSGMECAASEVGNVNIYINKDNKLQKTLSYYGKVSELCVNKFMVINRHSNTIEGSHLSSYLSITKDSVNLKAGIIYYTNSQKLLSVMVPSKLKADKTVSLKLTVNTFSMPQDKAEFVKAKTKDELLGVIYNTYTSKTKQKWLFVKLSFSDVILQNNVAGVDAKNTYILGWIKEPK